MVTAVLCGGRGSRLRPVTDDVPKPLIHLNGRPVLHHILDYYILQGFREFLLCVGYRGEMIKDYVLQAGLDADFDFSDAGPNASMLERLYVARKKLGPRAFVAYGDTLVTVDLAHMLKVHIEKGPSITMTIGSVKSPFGLVTFDESSWLSSFDEKPMLSYYIGHLLVETDFLDKIDSSLVKLEDGLGLIMLFRNLIEQKKILVHTHSGPQITFNTNQEREQAEREFVSFFTHS